jgi:release factor glutamine methyltransferase
MSETVAGILKRINKDQYSLRTFDRSFRPGPLAATVPLDLVRRFGIVEGAAAHLEPGGWLLFEHGYDQASAAGELLARAGFEERIGLQDLAGIPRVAGGRI